MNWWPWTHPNLRGDPNLAHAVRLSNSVFAWARRCRPLSVIVDTRLLRHGQRNAKFHYLLELLTDDSIDANFYGDGGPPAQVERDVNPENGAVAARGWVEIRPGDREDLRVVSCYESGVPTERTTRIGDPAFERMIFADPPDSYRQGGRADALQLADANAMLAAKAAHADLFVTERVLPLQLGHDSWSRVTVMSPDDAIPVVGLHLRRQRRYLIARTPALGGPNKPVRERAMTKTEFFWDAAEFLLVDSWRWEIAAGAHARRTGDPKLFLLATSIRHRIAQALRARDQLLLAMAVAQDMDATDDALDELDKILLWLLAAFDASARIVHVALGVEDQIKFAGWHNGRWLENLKPRNASLAAMFAAGTEPYNLLNLLKLLRNYIHGQALSAGGVVPVVGENALEAFVAVPDEDRQEILRTINALGGFAEWGARAPHPDYEIHLQPGVFAERLIATSIVVLNQLTTATPIQVLSPETPEENLLPWRQPLTLGVRRMLWQLGLMPQALPE